MRILRASAFGLISVLVACGGGGKSNTPDSGVPDSPPPDMPPPDMPPDMPALDFSCMGNPDPTTAADPIVISGTTSELTMSGPVALKGVTVDTFKAGTQNRVDRVVSDDTGAFTTGNIVTGGAALDGFLDASDPVGQMQATEYRSSILFPPTPLADNTANVPVLMISAQTFALLSGPLVANVQQDDTKNGVLVVAVTDCANTPISGATLSVKQASADVGTQYDLGQLSAQAAGIFFVFNVPDGSTEIGATFDGKTFRAHNVIAFKTSNAHPTGTLSTSIVRPGP